MMISRDHQRRQRHCAGRPGTQAVSAAAPWDSCACWAMTNTGTAMPSADQQARNDAGRKHGGHRLVRHPGVDDGDDRRRDDRRHDGRGDGERGGEIEVVALAHHLRDQERAERGDVGDGRARDAAEEHAVDDVDVGQPAAEAADERRGKVDDDAGDAAARRDVAGQDEQRRRQQQVGIRQQADEARRDDDRVERGIEHRGAQRADAHARC